MVEQDTGACEQTIAFTIVLGDPVTIQLCNAVRASRIERCLFGLRHFLYQTEHFRSGSLIEAAFRLYRTDRFQHVGNAQSVDLCGSQRLFPAGCYERLCSQIVHFVCLRDPHCGDQGDHVRHICIDEVDLVLDVLYVAVIHNALTTHDAVYFIALLQQQFCQIGAVLSCDTCNQCMFAHSNFFSFLYIRNRRFCF